MGRLIAAKRPELALRAFSSFLKDWPQATLAFVGAGSLRGKLEAAVTKTGLARNVHFLGIQTDIADILRNAHLLWQFSDGEGMPVVCLEAMAASIPIVASAVAGNCEVIEDGVTGWLFPGSNPVAAARISGELLHAPALYDQMARAARARAVGRFSLDLTIDGHMRAASAACA